MPLAALARELAANDWQERDQDRRGARTDRNVELRWSRQPSRFR